MTLYLPSVFRLKQCAKVQHCIIFLHSCSDDRRLLRPAQVYKQAERSRFTQYACFTQLQGGTWPALLEIGEGTCLSAPTASHISTYAAAEFERVRSTRALAS